MFYSTRRENQQICVDFVFVFPVKRVEQFPYYILTICVYDNIFLIWFFRLLYFVLDNESKTTYRHPGKRCMPYWFLNKRIMSDTYEYFTINHKLCKFNILYSSVINIWEYLRSKLILQVYSMLWTQQGNYNISMRVYIYFPSIYTEFVYDNN